MVGDSAPFCMFFGVSGGYITIRASNSWHIAAPLKAVLLAAGLEGSNIVDKKDFSNVMVVGFALFSMFFGAGNVIFPPYVGMGSAPHWFLSYYSLF